MFLKKKPIPNERERDFIVGHCSIFPNFFCLIMSYAHWRVDIVLAKDDIHTLADVIIVDLTWVDWFPRSCTIQIFAASNAAQAKKGAIATDTPLINSSISNWVIWLLTQTCWCVFTLLCQCHSELERAKGPHLSTLVIFLVKKFQLHYKGCKHPPS
jgi:hypothetical protein